MGTRTGHIIPGVGYLLIGLWQLYNHIKLYCKHPKSYKPQTWFPFPMVRHLELYFILFGSLTYLYTELVLGPSRNHLLDPVDWTIPTSHLHNFEHSTISLSLLIYAAFALRLDRVRPRAGHMLAYLMGAVAFAVEFLMFYLHSTNHTGIEWQYHRLLIISIAVSLAAALLGISHPRSFAVGFTRSVSVVFRGVWYNVIGVMFYTPRFIPKGCRQEEDEGFFTVSCDGPASVHRGKALVNLQFAWSFITVVVFSGWFYLHMAEKYPLEVTEYEYLVKEEKHEDGFPQSPTKKQPEQEKSGSLFLHMEKCFEKWKGNEI